MNTRNLGAGLWLAILISVLSPPVHAQAGPGRGGGGSDCTEARLLGWSVGDTISGTTGCTIGNAP